MYVCYQCSKSILPSELVFRELGRTQVPYHIYCIGLTKR